MNSRGKRIEKAEGSERHDEAQPTSGRDADIYTVFSQMDSLYDNHVLKSNPPHIEVHYCGVRYSLLRIQLMQTGEWRRVYLMRSYIS